ncbi:ankyrin, partial [Neocallimastix lanati (nom. inval.)]
KPEDLSKLVVDYFYREVHFGIDDVLDFRFIEEDRQFRKSIEKLVGRENVFKQIISLNDVQILENYFKKTGFTYYVTDDNINDDHNNILIFFIKNDAPLEYIKFILSHYDLPIDDINFDIDLVLSVALAEKKFQIANLLFHYGSKVMFSYRIFWYLIHYSSLNQQNFSYLLDIGFHTNSIYIYEPEFPYMLKYINIHYFFDKTCILKLLFHYKDRKKVSHDELLTIISHRSINLDQYKYTLNKRYYRLVSLYLQFNKREFQEIFKLFSKQLFEMVLESQDDYLTYEIVNNFKKSLSEFISLNISSTNETSQKLFKDFIQICFQNKTFDTKCIFLDHCLLCFRSISTWDNNDVFIKIFLDFFLHHPTFDFKFSRFNECVIVVKERGKILLRYAFDLFYHHPTFDTNAIELDRFLKSIKDMNQSETVKTATSKLMNQKYIMDFINQIFSHPTFDFISTFEKILKNKKYYLAIKYDSVICVKIIFKNIFRIKNYEKINFEHVLLKSIQYNRILIFKLLISMICRNNKFQNLMDRICLEKLLLESNKKSCKNIEIISIILEMLLEIPVTQEYLYINLPSLKTKDITYRSLLLNSIIRIGNLSLIKCLLENEEHSFNVNVSDENGDRPLTVAFKNCINNDNGLNIFRYLLSFKVENFNSSVHSLIRLICQNNLEGILLTLEKFTEIKKVSKISHKYSFCGFTPLIFSYLIGKKEIFEILLSNFNINELDGNGFNLLHYVVMKEDIKTLKYLIHFASTKEKELEFDELLYDISISIGNKELFIILLENITTQETLNSPLFIVLRNLQWARDIQLEFLKELIKRGCDVNCSDKNGKYALTYSMKTKCLSIVKLLIENGADVNVKNQNIENMNESRLLYSIRIHNIPIFEYMTIMFINKDNISEIQKSVIYRNNLDLLKILSSHHKLIHTKDYDHSPLVLAVKAGNIEMVKFLIKFYDYFNFKEYERYNIYRYSMRNDFRNI